MKINIPQISVIMGVYKEPISWVVQSVESILNQTFRDFEFIIVNDNPDYDELQTCLKRYQEKDDRIIIIENEQNVGLTKSLNKAIDQSKGKYIARMDADDISCNERLKIQFTFLENHKEVDLCGSWGRSFGDLSRFSLKIRRMPVSDDEIKANLLFSNPFLHPSVCFRRMIKNTQVRYNENAKRSQDYMLWYELFLMNATFYNINKPLVKYRISKNQISTNFTSDQISVSGPIRGQLLKRINPKVSDEDLTIHIDICTSNSLGISLDNKISYLNRLNEWCKNDKKYIFYRKCCVKKAIDTCLTYNKPTYIKQIAFINFRDFFDWHILRDLLKSFLR